MLNPYIEAWELRELVLTVRRRLFAQGPHVDQGHQDDARVEEL